MNPYLTWEFSAFESFAKRNPLLLQMCGYLIYVLP